MKYNDNGIWKDLTVKVSDTLPIGTVIPFAGNTVPSDWMVCDGSAISRTIYSTLFGVIGTSFGEGDGETTFNIPDLQGKVAVGVDSEDTDFDTLGETGGEKEHTLTIAEMPRHSHDMPKASGSDVYRYVASSGDRCTVDNVWTTLATGGNQPHNIMQPYQVVNYIIKVTKTVTGEYISETLPIGTELEFNGEATDIPDGWEQAVNPNLFSTTEEVKTGEIWIDGRYIYRKVFTQTVASYTTATIDLSSLGFYEAWVDQGNTFTHYAGRPSSSAAVFYAASNDYGLCYLNASGVLTLNNSNGNARTFFVTIKYTKASDQGGNS